MTRLTEILTSRSSLLSGDDYVTVVRQAADPVGELGRFRDRLLARLRSRQHELGGVTDARLRFAADTLSRARIRAAQLYLKRSSTEARTLGSYLRYNGDWALDELASGENADQLAEALLDALDSLHAYLLAHDLVGPGYEEAESALTERLLQASKEDYDEEVEEAQPLGNSAATAAKHNLALAA